MNQNFAWAIVKITYYVYQNSDVTVEKIVWDINKAESITNQLNQINQNPDCSYSFQITLVD